MWDELAFPQSAHKFCFHQYLPLFKVFLVSFELYFKQWKTIFLLVTLTKFSECFSEMLSFGGTEKNAFFRHFGVFTPLKMVNKYCFPKKLLPHHDWQYSSFKM
jgi:hypothetical protein